MTQVQPIKKTNKTIGERITHRKSLQCRIDEIKSVEFGAAWERTDALLRGAGRAELETMRYIQSVDETMAGWTDYEKTRLDQMRTKEKSAKASYDVARGHLDQLTKELNELENNSIHRLDSVNLNEVLQHQEAVTGAESKVSEIETLIDQQNEAIYNTSREGAPDGDLQQKREDILANIAAGMEPSKKAAAMGEIEALDKQVEDAKKITVVAGQLSEDATQTIRGLQRLLATAQADLNELNSLTADVMAFYLSSEAEKVGKEYALNAKKLRDNYIRLAALDRILSPSSGGFIAHNNNLMIPLPRLKSCGDEALSTVANGYFFQSKFFNAIHDAVEGEQQRLTGNGITISY